MKAVALTNLKTLETVITNEEPKPQAGEVLIRVKAVGVCGSDMHYFRSGRIGSQVVSFPFLLGHEFAGEVIQLGPEVKQFKVGDRVAVDPAMPCLECEQCKSGREHTCRNLKFLGCPGQADGCMKEQIVMPVHSCFKLPDGLFYDDGMLCEPFSIGIYAVKSFGDVRGLNAGILGFGPIGMSVASALKASGIKEWMVSEKLNYRLDMAAGFGSSLSLNPNREDIVEACNSHFKNQLDVVFECCGQQDAVHQAFEMLKPG